MVAPNLIESPHIDGDTIEAADQGYPRYPSISAAQEPRGVLRSDDQAHRSSRRTEEYQSTKRLVVRKFTAVDLDMPMELDSDPM